MRIPLVLSVAGRFFGHERRRIDGARLATATLRLWVRGRLGRTPKPIRLTATADGRRVRFLAWTYIDMLVAREVFLDRDYRVPGDLRPSTILDLGANTGISVRLLRELYPAALVIAVEPDPTNFDRLEQNAHGDPAVLLVRAAVAPERGRATFYARRAGWESSLEPRDDAQELSVELVTIESLLTQAGRSHADLVKIDIEGGEWPLLASGVLQASTACIVGELHFDEGRTRESVGAALPDFDVVIHRERGSVASFTASRR